MNKDQFNKQISSFDPALVEEDTLREAIDAFPYASSLHWLLAKYLHAKQDFEADKVTRKTAILSPDRSVLFDFILSETLKATIEKVDASLEEEIEAKADENTENDAPTQNQSMEVEKGSVKTPAEEEKETQTAVDEKIATASEVDLEREDQKEKEKKQDVSEAQTNLSPPKEEKKKESEETAKKQVSEEESKRLKKELEKQILSVAVSASISKEAADKSEETPVTPSKPEEDKEVEPTSAKGKQTFSGWLKTLKKEAPAKKQKFQQELIDQFIQNDPQITPKKVNFFSPTQQAKLSLAEDESFVTETLAQVYAKQGNHKKAIKAYENLMLKYPEKKAFFAGRIKEIKKQLKS